MANKKPNLVLVRLRTALLGVGFFATSALAVQALTTPVVSALPASYTQFAADTPAEAPTDYVYNPAGDCKSKSGASGNCITDDIQLLINVASAGVGIIIVIMIIIGGLQYTTAGANPSAVQSARKKIYNAIIALAALIFIYAFLQFIVPGGIF